MIIANVQQISEQLKRGFKMEYDFTKIPFDRLVKVGQIGMIHEDLFTVSWILGRYCNYNCSYCWPYARTNEKDHRPLELCIKTIRDIKQQARERGFNSFNFSLSGGEPTFHPHYFEIIQELADDTHNCNAQRLHMTTNLSRSLKWLKEYAILTSGFHRVSVTSSFHSEYANKENFVEKIIMLQEHDIHITINMVMVPEWFERDYENAMYFHDRDINVTLKPQSNPTASYVVEGYTDEMLAVLRNGLPQKDYTWRKQKKTGARARRPKAMNENRAGAPPGMQIEFTDDTGKLWYMDQAERFNAFNFNKFEGWECSSGYRAIIIREPDGAIKRSYSCQDEPLGTLETGFKLFDEPKICISPSCVSSADSKIPKRQSGTSGDLWCVNKNKQLNQVSLKFKDKAHDFSFKFIENGFDSYFDELYKFCQLAEKETTLTKTTNNMKARGWKDHPESLLYRVYHSRKYDNNNGAMSILYDTNGDICAFAGVERQTNDIAVMAKRYYVSRKYRFMPLLSTFIINPQIEWAERNGFKVCLITVNEYQRHTVLALFKRMKERKAVVLGENVYPNGNIYEDMKIVPCKVFINGEHQYIIIHYIDKNYHLNFEDLS